MKNVLAAALAATLAIGCAGTRESAPGAPAPRSASASPPPAAACAPAPSELVIIDTAPGEGRAVRFKSAVNVWYTGWLYDGCAKDFKGKQFDSNIGKMPFPLTVGAGRVIKGWDEGLVGIKEKGKRRLIIPPNKAYGPREFPDGRIPPNSTLVFEVELMNIVHQPEGS